MSQRNVVQGHVSQGHVSEDHVSQRHVSLRHVSPRHVSLEHVSQEHVSQQHVSQGHDQNGPCDHVSYLSSIKSVLSHWLCSPYSCYQFNLPVLSTPMDPICCNII